MPRNITDHFPPGAWVNSPEGRDAIGTDDGEVVVVQAKSYRERLVARVVAEIPELADIVLAANVA
jgi:HJR/Mrr/RecB family endonuclease